MCEYTDEAGELIKTIDKFLGIQDGVYSSPYPSGMHILQKEERGWIFREQKTNSGTTGFHSTIQEAIFAELKIKSHGIFKDLPVFCNNVQLTFENYKQYV